MDIERSEKIWKILRRKREGNGISMGGGGEGYKTKVSLIPGISGGVT